MTVEDLLKKLESAPECAKVQRGDGEEIKRVEIILTNTEDHVNIY